MICTPFFAARPLFFFSLYGKGGKKTSDGECENALAEKKIARHRGYFFFWREKKRRVSLEGAVAAFFLRHEKKNRIAVSAATQFFLAMKKKKNKNDAHGEVISL